MIGQQVHRRGITQLCFVGAGKWLLSIGMEEAARAYSWDWEAKVSQPSSSSELCAELLSCTDQIPGLRAHLHRHTTSRFEAHQLAAALLQTEWVHRRVSAVVCGFP